MTTTPPRFIVGESVRLVEAVQELESRNMMPAGYEGEVREVLLDGQYRVAMTGHVVSGYVVLARENQLVEATRPQRKFIFDKDSVVVGFVDRVAERGNGGVFMLLMTLQGRHESFVLLATTSDEEYSMRLTRPGDKVTFTITEPDTDRPRGKGFANFALY